MVFLIFLLLLLLLLFGLVFVLVEQWESLKRQLLLRLAIVLIVVGALLVGVRYWLVSAVGCIPYCVGASLVGRDLAGYDLNGANFI